MLLTRAALVSGLAGGLSRVLSPWRKPFVVHDPGKIIMDLAISLALGGDCLADIALLRAEPAVYSRFASDPTVSRLIGTLAADAPKALQAIAAARADARARVWQLACRNAPNHEVSPSTPLVIDIDATLVSAHSDKEQAQPTFKKGYGFHSLCAFVDHGPDGTGEPLAILLRPGNAGSNTATDHITVLRDAFKQLLGLTGYRPGRQVLVRVDGAGHSHRLIDWLTAQRVQYSVGFTLPGDVGDALELIPAHVWQPAYDADGGIREGAWVAELTGLLDLSGWPTDMRVIPRKERPHPGAQLRITDIDGHRITAFATNTRRGQLADLELRHRRRARCEDRIRLAKNTGLTNPAPARLHTKPDLVRHRRVGVRAHRMAATPRPDRPRRPQVGTPPTAAPAPHDPRSAGPRRPPSPAPLRLPPPLGRPPHRRADRPGRARPLTARHHNSHHKPNHPQDSGSPGPTGATSGNCHTHPAESDQHGDPQAVTTTQPHPMKDRG